MNRKYLNNRNDAISSERHRLRTAIDLSPDCIFAKDLEFRLILVNKSLSNLMELTPEDMENRFDYEFWPKEKCFGNPEIGLRGYHDDDSEAFNGKSTKVRETVALADGVDHIFETHRVPLNDSSGAIYGVLGYARDITNDLLVDKKNIQLEKINGVLAESEKRFRNLFDNAANGIITTDDCGNINAFNYASEKLFGYKLDEIKNKNVKMLTEEDIQNNHDGYIERYSITGESIIIGKGREVIGLHKDGHKLELYISISKNITENGVEFMALVHDLSTEKEIQRELQASEAYFRLLSDASFEGIVIYDHANIVDVNTRCSEMFGYKREEIIGKQMLPIIFTSESQEIARQRIESNLFEPYELDCIKKDGTIFPGEILPSKKEINKKVVRIIAIRDISNTKQQQYILRKAKEEAENANKAKTQFISSMSHELRTPLNAVIGFSQLLQLDDISPEETKKDAKEILNAGHHLLNLINEILDLARIESGIADINLEVVDIEEILGTCTKFVEISAGDNGISLITEEIELENTKVIADKLRLKQVILNLLSNAIKYNKENGSVSISVRQDNAGQLSVKITDTGRGLSEKEMSLLFEPFNRLGVENGSIQGTGIGLTITKQLIEKMNGTIDIQSTLGQGTSFSVSFPSAMGVLAREVNDRRDIKMNPKDAVSGQINLLYVEDTISNQKIIQAMMRSRDDVNLTLAASAEFALVLINECKPDMILLDINLPGMSGYEFIEYLKSVMDYRSIPVIAVTAKAMSEDLEKAKQYGFAAYITKPIVINDLMRAIDQNK